MLLRHASLVRLVAIHGPGVRPGLFEAHLGGEIGRAELSLKADPTACKAPLAFSRLARALGAGVVPITVHRMLTFDELGAALDHDPDARPLMRELAVQNDGTVDVLLATRAGSSARSPWGLPGAPVDVTAGREVATWDRWASAPAPAPDEDSALLRDYVEMLVLDYLAANVARREALRVDHALVLADNGSAFPPHANRPTLDRMLRRLRGVARFPRGLRVALGGFDRARAAAAFAQGGFATWLLSPRTLVELDERRAALLTLIEARVAERGAEAVLTL